MPLLLKAGADVHFVNRSGRTALHQIVGNFYESATMAVESQVVKALVDAGANPEHSVNGRTIVQIAESKGLFQTAALLRSRIKK